MADISKEIQDFKGAICGEEVRGSMISLAEKLNKEVEDNTTNVSNAVENVNNAIATAKAAESSALAAAKNANDAAKNTEALRQDIENRLEAGEFKGDKGEKGDPGQNGIMAQSSGMFSLYLDPDTGNLYAEYPDGETPPQFEYDAETGNLYYVTDDTGD